MSQSLSSVDDKTTARTASTKKPSGTAIAFAAACAAGQRDTFLALVFPARPVASIATADLGREAIVFTAKAIDDFTLIRGLDAAAVTVLESHGLTHYADLAAFTPEDMAILGEALGDKRRIAKQGWIEQAALLAAGTLTRFASERRQALALEAGETEARKSEFTAKPVESAPIAASEIAAAGDNAQVAVVLDFPRKIVISVERRAPSTAISAALPATVVALDHHRAKKARRRAPALRMAAVAALAAVVTIASTSGLDSLWLQAGVATCRDGLFAIAGTCAELSWLGF